MEERRSSSSTVVIHHLTVIGLAAFAMGLLAGCGSARKRDSNEGVAPAPGQQEEVAEGEQGPPEPYGPQPTMSGPVFGPSAPSSTPITVVLGAGLARGFAAAGALRALQDAKIPIGRIVATESGALIAVLFGMTRSANEFEFALMRLKEDAFIGRSGLLGGLIGRSSAQSDGEQLEKALEQILGNRDLSESRIPISIVLSTDQDRKIADIDRGEASAVARCSMGAPGFMDACEWKQERWLPGSVESPLPVKSAKDSSSAPILVLDTLTGTDMNRLTPELAAYLARAKRRVDVSGAQIVLSPDLKAVGPMDFSKRSEAIFSGKTAVRKNLGEVKKLAGLDP